MPLFVADVDRRQRLAADARRADGDVERAELGADPSHGRVDIFRATHVSVDRQHPVEIDGA